MKVLQVFGNQFLIEIKYCVLLLLSILTSTYGNFIEESLTVCYIKDTRMLKFNETTFKSVYGRYGGYVKIHVEHRAEEKDYTEKKCCTCPKSINMPNCKKNCKCVDNLFIYDEKLNLCRLHDDEAEDLFRAKNVNGFLETTMFVSLLLLMMLVTALCLSVMSLMSHERKREKPKVYKEITYKNIYHDSPNILLQDLNESIQIV